jgi:hypothetical protein
VSTDRRPAPTGTGPAEKVAATASLKPKSSVLSAFDRVTWEHAATRHPLSTAARLVVGQLAGRADRRGQVRGTPADIASSCCLPVTKVDTALAVLGSYGLLGRAGRVLLLVAPQGGVK